LPAIDDEARALLLSYPWPGNVRELRNAIERAVVVAHDGVIRAADLPARVQAARAAEPPPAAAGKAAPAPELRTKLQQVEAEAIQAAMEAVGWKRADAARRLGMPLRTLARKIKVLGISKPGE
jgi:DNA-binding NtrC family response regulator